MRRRVNLQSFPFASNGNAIIPMDGLPQGDRLISILLHLPFSALQNAAAALITSATINRLVDKVTMGRRLNGVGGQALNALYWAMTGRDPSLPADIPATNSWSPSRTTMRSIPTTAPAWPVSSRTPRWW
jgi:hypothetical protein